LDQLQQVKFLKKQYLKLGYYQVRIKEEDLWKTTSMCLMNDVTCQFIDYFVIVYPDGIPIFSSCWKEHISHVTKVLETLKITQMIANLKKCEFEKEPLILSQPYD
jgi:hypothetical protein